MPDPIPQISHKPTGSPEQESTEGMDVDVVAFARILDLYKKQITFPDQKPERKFFLCPIGLVGAGKTTVIKPLAERLHLLRISTDEIRKLLKEEGYNRVRTAELAFRLTREFAQDGYSIAVDGDCAGNNVTDAIKQSAKALGAELFWIHINPPEHFIINKLTHFKHTWLFKDSADALASYDRRKPLHEKLDYPFIYTFDTSRENLSQQINEAASIIQGALECED